MTRAESRYFNTARKIDDAFTLLLDEKDYEYISIIDICRKAGVNRSTFYLHYENISDVAEETCENLLKDFLEYYPSRNTKDVLKDIFSGDKEKLVFLTPEYLLPFLSFIKDNRKLFSIVLSEGRVFRHNETFNALFKYIFEPICVLFGISTDERQYYVRFFITGIIAVVKEWLKNDCRETTETIIKIIMNCLNCRKEGSMSSTQDIS